MTTKRRLWAMLIGVGVALQIAAPDTLTMNGAGLLSLVLMCAGILGLSTEVKE